jgi:flavin reductase (DIM6/NTAB) family NADH-FMN oxidoreductase RutF
MMELTHDMLIHGVYVVSAQHQGRRGGLALAWATQVGTDAVLICVGEQSSTRELILASGAFGLSLLAADQVDIARHFGRHSSLKLDKFEGLGYHTSATGSPLLDRCALTLDCRVSDVYDFGTQKLIVGRIEAAERPRAEFEPLIYSEEDY